MNHVPTPGHHYPSMPDPGTITDFSRKKNDVPGLPREGVGAGAI